MGFIADATITLEGYLAYCQKTAAAAIKEPVDLDQASKMFKLVDRDGSGEVDYFEFVNHETCMVLREKLPETLASFLTDREMARIAQMFKYSDMESNGFLLMSDVKHAYIDWYSVFNHMQQEYQQYTSAK